jgi:hypothetical protein
LGSFSSVKAASLSLLRGTIVLVRRQNGGHGPYEEEVSNGGENRGGAPYGYPYEYEGGFGLENGGGGGALV